MSIQIISWDEEKFLNSQDDWSELLARSDSDRLFMSWEWLYTWWKIFKDEKNMSLRLYVAIDENNKLVGIAPLYITKVIAKRVVRTSRLQFIGNCWRGRITMPTEMMDFIVDRDVSIKVISSLYRHINESDEWSEFVLSNLSMKTATYECLLNDGNFENCYHRCAETYNSYYLDTTDSFDNYLKKISKNVRLKLFNRRTLINSIGQVSFKKLDIDLDDSFTLLNRLHKNRWGTEIFEGDRLKFNKSVAKLMSKNKSLQFNVILFNNKPISIQYNYIVNNRKYNIQAGFDESFHKKISLGYLHFGYEIEDCFEGDIVAYDFLMGEGKNIQYKERLTNIKLKVVDMQIIRNKNISFLYKLYDRIKTVVN